MQCPPCTVEPLSKQARRLAAVKENMKTDPAVQLGDSRPRRLLARTAAICRPPAVPQEPVLGGPAWRFRGALPAVLLSLGVPGLF